MNFLGLASILDEAAVNEEVKQEYFHNCTHVLGNDVIK